MGLRSQITKAGLALLSFTGAAQTVAQTADHGDHAHHAGHDHTHDHAPSTKTWPEDKNAMTSLGYTGAEIEAMWADLDETRYERDSMLAAFSMPDTPEEWTALAQEDPIFAKNNGLRITPPRDHNTGIGIELLLEQNKGFFYTADPDIAGNVIVIPARTFEVARSSAVVKAYDNGLERIPDMVLTGSMERNMSIDLSQDGHLLKIYLGGLLSYDAPNGEIVPCSMRDVGNIVEHEVGHSIHCRAEGSLAQYNLLSDHRIESSADSLGNIGPKEDYIGDVIVNIKSIILNGGEDIVSDTHPRSTDRIRQILRMFARDTSMPLEDREKAYRELEACNEWLANSTAVKCDLVAYYHEQFAKTLPEKKTAFAPEVTDAVSAALAGNKPAILPDEFTTQGTAQPWKNRINTGKPAGPAGTLFRR